MTSFIRTAAATLAAAASLAAAVPATAQTPLPQGLWINPHHSVAVRTGSCGQKLCGWIAWADAEAQSDARDSGVQRLVGTELLENYEPDGANSWAGTVYVPDKDHHFTSEIDQLSTNELKIKGCILGGLICRSQLWTRIARLPQ